MTVVLLLVIDPIVDGLRRNKDDDDAVGILVFNDEFGVNSTDTDLLLIDEDMRKGRPSFGGVFVLALAV
jgi:hypothetical protein